MAYPSAVANFKEADYPAALNSAGLDHLVGKLDMQKRWDKKLSEDEQDALAFARVQLQRPDWLLIDEVLDSMEDTTHERVIDMLARGLKKTGVIHIGKTEAHDHIFFVRF